MRNTSNQRIILVLSLLTMVLGICGCKKASQEIIKVRDIEYSVVEEADLPQELMQEINKNKDKPFKMTYTTEKELYLIRGYGQQKSGGYSISVDNLFLAENGIHLETTLIGPKAEELVTQVTTYPYIAIKTELLDEKVIFH